MTNLFHLLLFCSEHLQPDFAEFQVTKLTMDPSCGDRTD